MRTIRIVVFALMSAAAVAPTADQVTSSGAAFRVGAARVDITPPAATGSPAPAYEHERLYVRAIVIENDTTRAALISADQGNMPEEVWMAASKEIAAELKAPVQNILMSATHTHSSTVTGPGRAGPGAAAAPAPVANQAPPPLVAPMLQVVRQAKAALQPARVGFGTGSMGLNVNRDAIDAETRNWTQAPNREAYSDKTVAVLSFESLSGVPIAAYINYAMHPVNGYLSGVISADFPGAATRYIEQAYGGQMVALLSQGASGDQNPLYLRPGTNLMASRTGVPITGKVLVRENVEGPLRDGTVPATAGDAKVRDALLRWIEAQGMLLGEEVIRVMTDTTSFDSRPGIRGTQKTISCPGRTRTGGAREGGPGQYAPAEPVQLRMGALLIGSTALASVNAELYSTIARRLRERSPLSHTVMVTLANGRAASGYVPDDASYGHYTFQVNGSRLEPGCAEGAIANGLAGMLEELK